MGAPLGGLDACLHSYFHWNGRLGELLRVAFGSYLAHTPIFAFINAFFGASIFYLLFFLILGRLPQLNYIDSAYIALMLFVFMTIRAFGATFYWAAGSLNYLWTWSFILAWLVPYRIFWRNYVSGISYTSSRSALKALGMLILGILAGWGSELGIVVIVAQVVLFFVGVFSRVKLPLWYYAGIMGFIVGWGILYASPGHRERASLFEHYIGIGDFFAMDLEHKLLRIQETFGSHHYPIISVVMFALITLYLHLLKIARIYKIVLGVVSLVVIVCIGEVFRRKLGFLLPLTEMVLAFYLAWVLYAQQEYSKARHAFILGILMVVYSLAVGATIQITIPSRAKLPYYFLDIGSIILLCLMIKDYFGDYFKQKLQLMLITLCVLCGLFVLVACVDMRIKWERMISAIDSHKIVGKQEVIISADTFRSYYSKYGNWGNPTDNPDGWPNTVYARVFGVEKFIAK